MASLAFFHRSHLYLLSHADHKTSTVVLMPATPSQTSTTAAPSTTKSTAPTLTAICNTSMPIIQNGGFESGSLSPWTTQSTVRGSYSYGSVDSPGSTNFGGGNYAFTAQLVTPNSPYGNGAVTQTLSQTLNTCPGANYTITADYNVVYYQFGTCTISMNGQVVSNGASSGSWHTATGKFTAASNADSVDFAFTCQTPGQLRLDNVNITRV